MGRSFGFFNDRVNVSWRSYILAYATRLFMRIRELLISSKRAFPSTFRGLRETPNLKSVVI
jgi:hypothetical protein